MTLLFHDQRTFTTGSCPYLYQPSQHGDSPRIIVSLIVDSFHTTAMVDTGGVFLLCSPDVAASIDLTSKLKLTQHRVLFRGVWYDGTLYRMPVSLIDEQGLSLSFEATTFVPDLRQDQPWPIEIPCILGMYNCLDRLRFAIDPTDDTFYFGALE